MNSSLFLRYVWRESRGSLGRLVFFTACLSVGVAAVVAVAGLSDALDEAVRGQARNLLAADLAVESRRPLPAELDAELNRVPRALRASLKEMPTVVAVPSGDGTPGPSLLVELKVVEGEYPFYGKLVLEPEHPLESLLTDSTAVVAPELLRRLQLGVGDRLLIGGKAFEIVGTVTKEPDKLNISLTLGPRVFLSAAGLERAELERFGSRIRYRVLVKLGPASSKQDVQRLARRLADTLPDSEYLDIETYAEAQPGLRSGIRQVERYLGLVALLSLLIGGIGVAQAVRAWLASRLDTIAVLKSLGFRPREVLAMYLGQTAALGLAGSLVGVGAGVLVQLTLPVVVGDLLPIERLQPWQPLAALRGIALGMGVALLFSLPTLLEIRRVPPARVFRSDAEPLVGSRLAWWGAVLLLILGMGTMAVWQTGSLAWGVEFTLGVLVVAGLLGGTAAATVRLVGSVPRRAVRVWVRHGLGALSRPGAGTLGAVVALGLGVVVVLAMYLVQDGLSTELTSALPEDAPTGFFIDIQREQWEPLKALLERQGASGIDSVPVIVGRLRAVDGRTVEELLARNADEGRRRWILTREQRLTYMEQLPEDNVVVEGALWSDPALPEISIEREFADDLGAGVGSRLLFDIQGVPLELTVTSLRSVEWGSFGINFFLVVEPGVLDEAPQYRVAVARLSADAEQEVQDLMAADFPNVTFLHIRRIVEQITAVLERLGLGVRILGSFTMLAGVAILGGAVSAGTVRRSREVALLKTLGMTRRGVVAVFSTEYALLGLVAGIIGSLGGGVLAWAVLTRVLDLTWTSRPLVQIVAVGATVALAVIAGLASSTRALTQRPVEVLREE